MSHAVEGRAQWFFVSTQVQGRGHSRQGTMKVFFGAFFSNSQKNCCCRTTRSVMISPGARQCTDRNSLVCKVLRTHGDAGCDAAVGGGAGEAGVPAVLSEPRSARPTGSAEHAGPRGTRWAGASRGPHSSAARPRRAYDDGAVEVPQHFCHAGAVARHRHVASCCCAEGSLNISFESLPPPPRCVMSLRRRVPEHLF